MNKSMIGRRLLKESRPEQVYVLKWKEKKSQNKGEETRRPPSQAEATFKRVPSKNPKAAEGLELIEITGEASDGTKVSKDDYELKLCTLESGEHWIDEARFEVCWPDNDNSEELSDDSARFKYSGKDGITGEKTPSDQFVKHESTYNF